MRIHPDDDDATKESDDGNARLQQHTDNPDSKDRSKKRKKKQMTKFSSGKKREVTGTAHIPTNAMLRFSMGHYELYDPATNDIATPFTGAHTSFENYDGYRLFMVPSALDVKIIPTGGIRLDDMHIAIVLESGEFSNKQLTGNWQGEFDKKGMTRATRVPLGHAAKAWKDIGDKDIDGNVLKAGEQGWYYLWHRGLQMLGGQESIDAKMHLQRPSHERDRCTGITWKKGFRAAIQLAPGNPNDATFTTMDLPEFGLLPNDGPENSVGVEDGHFNQGESSSKGGKGGQEDCSCSQEGRWKEGTREKALIPIES